MSSKLFRNQLASLLLLALIAIPSTTLWAMDSDDDSFDDIVDVDDDGDGLIEIASLTELDYMRNNLLGTALNDGVNGDNSTGCGDGDTITVCNGYELINDLDFNTNTSDAVQVIDDKDQFFNAGAGWVPVGEDNFFTAFKGTFEGNGHTIFNLFINNTTDVNVGLFGRVEGSGNDVVIRNLNFAGELSEVVGSANFYKVGTLAGRIRDATVSSIHAEVNVGGTSSSNSTVGGLMGFARANTMSDLSVVGEVDGNINGNTFGAFFSGGLIGQMSGGLLQNSWSQANVRDGLRSGGLVGQAAPFPSSVNGDDDADIEASFASGNVTTSGTGGGLVGQMNSTSIAPGANLSNVFATGDVTAQSAAGLVGLIGFSGNYSIINAFATGSVVATGTSSSAGGLISQASTSGQIQVVDAYWDVQTTGQSSSASSALGLTTEQLQCPTTNTQDCANGGGLYLNWPTDIWNFGASIQYPALILGGVVQRDTDGDGELDSNDTDDDNDGISDGSDLCPFDPDASNTNFDADDQCDANDPDDDNDGYTDVDENSNGGQSNPFSAVSFPADNDNDFVSDFNDPDDDNDGYTDIDELSNNGQSDPFNANSTPPDQDGDFISDFLDDDDDNDTVLDGDDNCPLDADTDNVNTDGDDLCNNNDLDDDDDTVLDGDDNCPLTENQDQANNDSDDNGDACDDDDDNDTVLDDNDNCPFDFNLNQADSDSDDFGDVCDVDRDGDRLIEIFNLTQLDAIRNALDGSNINGDSQGCSEGQSSASCNGFEVSGFLDFNTDRSDEVQVIDDKDAFFNGGAGWQPIGTAAAPFTGRFNGNFRSIFNLFINNNDMEDVGLFGYVSGAEIRNLFLQGELTSVSSTRPDTRVGTLAGTIDGALISDVLARTAVSGIESSEVGGLFGEALAGARVERSFASGAVNSSGSGSSAGGLIGVTDGNNGEVVLLNVLSDANVVAQTNSFAGGLVARSSDTEIENAITYGILSGSAQRGAMVADDNNSTTFIASYWDLNIATQLGYSSDGGDGRPTAQLQCPTNITPNQVCAGGMQIYQDWRGNQAWHFGTSFQYPVRRTNGTIQRDTDGDGILDGQESDPDDDGFGFGVDLCPFDQDFANVNSDDDDQCDVRDVDDDNDGYSDIDENDNGSSPIDANETPPDNDGDFISDLNDPDDDNDGNLDALDLCIFDADVANQNFDGDELCDTNDPDDDNDGVEDTLEIVAGLNPFDANDLSGDADGDGFSNGEEAQAGTDPFSAGSTPLTAGAPALNDWTSTGPNGGFLSGLFVDPSNANFAYAFANSDIYQTRDRGLNWQRFTDNLLPDSLSNSFFSLAVDPNDSDTIYVTNRRNANRLFKTEDAGETWQLMENGLTISPQQIFADPISSDIFYITGPNSEVFRTLNAAASWSQVGTIPTTNLYRGALSIARSNSAVIYAFSNDGMFVSSDGGANWVTRNTGLAASLQVRAIAVDPGNADIAYAYIPNEGLFRTTDRGVNWARIDTGTSIASLFANVFIIDADVPTTLYFGNGISVYKSLDSGVNWLESNTGLEGLSSGNSLAASPADPSVLYLTGSPPAFVSSDGAQSWQLRDNGVHRLQIDSVERVAGENEIVMGSRSGNQGSYVTKSAGKRWDRKAEGIAGRVFGVAVDPNNSDVRYAGGDNVIFKSTDAGETWSDPGFSVFGAFSRVVVDPNDSNVIYARSLNEGLVRSIDAGLSWEIATAGLPTLQGFEVSDIAVLGNAVYLSLSFGNAGLGGVYKSSNRGALWFAVNNGSMTSNTSLNHLTADEQNSTLYAMGNGAPYITTDGGANWGRLNSIPFSQNFAVDKEATEILYSSNFGQVSRSADSGVSWQPLPTLVRAGFIREMVSGPQGSSILHAGTGALGMQAIQLATDLVVEAQVQQSRVIEGLGFTYEFSITNNGPFDESRVVFEQKLSAFADQVNEVVAEQGTCEVSNGAVRCELGLLADGQTTTITVETTAERAGVIASAVSVSGYLSELSEVDSDINALLTAIPDTDGDTIPDFDDPNDDNDNFPDASDNCSLVANNSQANFDGDAQGDACDTDDDNDGISDTAEQQNGLNPRNAADALQDFDGDGLNNRQEIDLRTDLRNADTDGDGVDDGTEVALGRNPRLDESKPVPISAIVNLLLLD